MSPPAADEAGGVNAAPGPILKVAGLVRRFGRIMALDRVDLRVQAGEIVGLIGPNGAGKTTLIDVVAGKIRPNAGEVQFCGRRITGLPAHKIGRLGIARTSQVVKPFIGMTTLEIVTVGALFGADAARNVAAGRARAEEAIARLGLGDQRDKPAENLNIVDRKRMELARALVMEPTLLLLDEVMAGLVPAEVQALVEIVLQLRKAGVTIIVVEHVMRAITSLADRLIVLHQGRVLAQGPPDLMLRDQRVVEAYLGRGRTYPTPGGRISFSPSTSER